jgi:hypothetical protein
MFSFLPFVSVTRLVISLLSTSSQLFETTLVEDDCMTKTLMRLICGNLGLHPCVARSLISDCRSSKSVTHKFPLNRELTGVIIIGGHVHSRVGRRGSHMTILHLAAIQLVTSPKRICQVRNLHYQQQFSIRFTVQLILLKSTRAFIKEMVKINVEYWYVFSSYSFFCHSNYVFFSFLHSGG